MKKSLLALISVSLFIAIGCHYQKTGKAEFSIKENYYKKEFRIPMRDGKTLFTSVYIPKDSSRSYPILLLRTPYGVGPYGKDKFKRNLGPSKAFAEQGYIFAYQDVRGDIMRAKFRDDYSHPKAMIPNEVTEIKLPLQDVFHTFKKGHRIMVQIQSSWFPLFDRNPQKFTDIYSAGEEDFQKAQQRVYFSKQYPSQIRFFQLPTDKIQK